MTEDIVKRLRRHCISTDWQVAINEAHDAADEIERLRAALREIANIGQTKEPDHWAFRCKARDIAKAALKEKAND